MNSVKMPVKSLESTIQQLQRAGNMDLQHNSSVFLLIIMGWLHVAWGEKAPELRKGRPGSSGLPCKLTSLPNIDAVTVLLAPLAP